MAGRVDPASMNLCCKLFYRLARTLDVGEIFPNAAVSVATSPDSFPKLRMAVDVVGEDAGLMHDFGPIPA